MKNLLKTLVAMAAGVGGYFAVKFLVTTYLLGGGTVTQDEVAEMLAKQPGNGFIEILRERSPGEYDEMMGAFTTLANSGVGPQQAFAQGVEIGASIRRRNAHYLWQAPQDSIIALLNAQRAVLAAFEDDRTTCNALLMAGPGALNPTDAAKIMPQIDASAKAVFTAIYDGRDNADRMEAPSMADYDSVMAAWVAGGATDGMVDAVTAPTSGNPMLCPAFLSFFDHLATGDGPSIQRVRTEFAVNANQY